MSVISIKNRLARMEEDRGTGRLPFVVVLGDQSDSDAYARAGLRLDDPAHVLRINFVSARAA